MEQITVYLQDIKWNDPCISIQVEPAYTALDVVKLIVNKTRQFNYNNYELAEIFVSSGQLCKERRLDMSEIPYQVQSLWPTGGALAPDATYRFYLVRKGAGGGFLRSLSWTDCNTRAVDVPSDSYLIKFLDQKTAGENCADMCALPDLNEKTLLDNLKKRFYADKIYTYVGTILIAINPFKFFPIYNPKYVSMYQDGGYRQGELPPHIFAIANAAFTTMLDTQTDQCIVISGESGSGKTENTNFLLHHLTQTKHGQQQQNHHGSGVEQTLLGAGPVLEAFGNAKTVHNDNSSRFGKFIQVDFRKNGAVHGASVEKYLLEKSRIVSQANNERNYHVFYYLLSGASEELARELFLMKTEDYLYLNQSEVYGNQRVDEVQEFERLKCSMEMVGFKQDLQKRIFAVISAILLLGNVEFVKKHTYHHDDAVQVKNIELVSKICKLLDVKEEAFLEALTSKRTVAGGETMVVRYKLADAISARNAMAKCLYGAIFDWMVWQINHALYQKQDHKDTKSNSIGVLDIFGFEDFNKNSFEQFCINYANEHLQYYFNQHIFKFEQDEYKREKIDWQNISFTDNRRCLDLFAKRPSGLFFLLDEEGNFPGATNETLLEKFHQNHKNSEYYVMPMRRESTFTIRHYAGQVKYHIRDFREKNSDLIHADLVSVLKNSNTGFVRELVGCDPVAMLRWQYVRLCMKCVNAFMQAGKAYHNRGGHHVVHNRDCAHNNHDCANHLIAKWNKIGNMRRKSSITQKHSTREYLGLPWSDHSETESGDQAEEPDGSCIYRTAKKAKRRHSARSRAKKYKDFKQFRTYQEVKNRTETSKTKTPSVSLQFQKSLQSLLETLDRSHPYFVRCIKSNMQKEPCQFDDKLVLRQLQYTGMLATVRLRQSGYNYRVLFEEFVQNYASLLPKGKLSTREDVDNFLTSMDSNNSCKGVQVGRSKVFLRETVKMLLDDALHHTLMRQVLRLQSWVRSVLARRHYMDMKDAALAIQRVYRGVLSRRSTKPKLDAYRADQERLQHEAEQRRLEKERLRVEQERIDKERQARLEEERLEKERLEKEQLEQERLKEEQLEKERLELERLELERLERKRLDELRRCQEEEERLAAEQKRKLEEEQLEKKKQLELELEELKLQQHEEEVKRRQHEEEAERQHLIAEEQWREVEIHQRCAELRRTHAARNIQKWYKMRKAIINDAKSRAGSLPTEPSEVPQSPTEPLPYTDIDQLVAQSIEDHEPAAVPQTNHVESLVDKETPAVNGHPEDAPAEDTIEHEDNTVSPVSNGTSEHRKEEHDEIPSIIDTAPVSKPSSPKRSDRINRRASIERRVAFRRRSTKDDDVVIPVVQKKSPSSPSISSSDGSEVNQQVPDEHLSPTSPLSPPSALTPAEPVTPSTDSLSDSKEVDTTPAVPESERLTPNTDITPVQDSFVSYERRLSGSSVKPKTHSRVSSDTAAIIKNRPSPEHSVNLRQKQPLEMRASNLFYTPEKPSNDMKQSHSSRHSLPSNINSNIETEQHQSEKTPPPVAPKPTERRPPSSLPLAATAVCLPTELNSPVVEPPKPLVRRTSSNDPTYLRRTISKSTERLSDSASCISPENLLSPSPHSLMRQSSGASSIDLDDPRMKFTRTHVLRKNVQVRKSQSADNLAPAALNAAISLEHDINLKHGHVKNGPHPGALKSNSYDTLSHKGSIDAGIQAYGAAAAEKHRKRSDMRRQESDDSDLGGHYSSVPLTPLNTPLDIPPPTMGEKRKIDAGRGGSKKSSGMTVSSTSEWNYPESLALEDSDEVSELSRFIYDKYFEFGWSNVEEAKLTVYERVFKGALREMNKLIVTNNALSMSPSYSFHPLKFRDLMSNFRDIVAMHVEKNLPREEALQFPTTIAVNAFRSYLDEYLKRPKKKRPKPKPSKQHQQAQKTNVKKKTKEVTKILGHQMIAAQFNIPTFCEVCNKMMFWNIREKGLECENCKFSCHKKCNLQIQSACPHAPPEDIKPNAVFGVPLHLLAGEDNTCPPVLDKLIAELDNRGVYTAGIYRKSGAAQRVRTLRKALNSDWESVNLSDYAVHVISLTLKNFFRELPEPLFRFDLYDEFIRCTDIQNTEEAVSAMRATVDKLPPVNLSVIGRLMLHLARIAQNEPINMMSCNALSIVFAPGLVRTKKPMTAQQSLMQVGKQCRTVELMLNATLKKLNETLNDIDELETEQQTLQDRLTDVRQSMRRQSKKPAGYKKKDTMHTHTEIAETSSVDIDNNSDIASVSDTISITSDTPTVDIEQAQQEEKAISAKIRTVQEKKDLLKKTIPRLTLAGSDGDDMASTDDIESSAESLDDFT